MQIIHPPKPSQNHEPVGCDIARSLLRKLTQTNNEINEDEFWEVFPPNPLDDAPEPQIKHEDDREIGPPDIAAVLDADRPVVVPVALTLLLARQVAADGGKLIGSLPAITLITGWNASALEQLSKLLLNSLPEGTLVAPDFQIVLLADEGGRSAMKQSRAYGRIREALEQGRRIIVLVQTPEELGDEFSPFYRQHIVLKRPDRTLIKDLCYVLHGAEACPEPGQLPEDIELARLGGLEIETAFRQVSVEETLNMLHDFTRRKKSTSGPSLDRVRGQEGAVEYLHQIAQDLGEWQAGRLDWSEVTRSVLLYGPPGTGKTMLAQALASTAGCPLIITSFAECQGSGSGHMGDMLSALNNQVDAAIAQAPSVLFIDELDGFGRRDGSARHNEQYMRSVVTGLLRQIDRLMATPGVVLIGATNDRDAIDPAILRDGRFDRHVAINSPSPEGLVQILRDNLPETITVPDDVLAECGLRLAGTSGATAMTLARKALSRARAERREVTEDDLQAVLDADHPALSKRELHRIAVHEAGHVVVGSLSGLPKPELARLTPTGGEVVFREPPFHTRASALARIRTLLAGRVAEELLFGSVTSGAGEGPASDLAQATMLACKMETEFGFGKGGLVWQSSESDRLIALIPWLRPRIQQHLSDASSQARAILLKKINAVELIATALVQERELQSERLEQLMSIQDALMSSFANESDPHGTAAGTVIPFPKRGEG